MQTSKILGPMSNLAAFKKFQIEIHEVTMNSITKYWNESTRL